MNIYTIDAHVYDETNLNVNMIIKLITKHSHVASKIINNRNYYLGNHRILQREKKMKSSSNEKLVCNHAKDISDTATGYFLNSPIAYSSYDKKDDLFVNEITDKFDKANVDDVDSDNAHDMSVAGVAYEYVYALKDRSELSIRNLEPENTFLVYDDTIEQNLLFGVYYFRITDAISDKKKYKATVCTKNFIYEMIIEGDEANHVREPFEHHMGNVPIVEYRNNKHMIGDYEQQISLIDAYNVLMSDRVNDKVQFVESLLVIYGALMGDDNEEVSEAVKVLKEHGLLELPSDARAEYIARTFDEAGMEILRKAIKEDIYTFSHVPNLTDENFVGNSSGVAMEYKLLGLQMITNEKEKYYKKGLKRRIQLFTNFMNLKKATQEVTDEGTVKITFSRKLPKNMSELANMIANLKGTVSQETLISQLDFVEDAQNEIQKVSAENDENIKRQQSLFASGYNNPIVSYSSDKEDIEE